MEILEIITLLFIHAIFGARLFQEETFSIGWMLKAWFCSPIQQEVRCLKHNINKNFLCTKEEYIIATSSLQHRVIRNRGRKQALNGNVNFIFR